MPELLETKEQAIALIEEKATASAEKYIKDNGAAVVNSIEGRKAINGMITESFDSFKLKHADNDVTLAEYVNIMQKQFDDMALKLKEEKGAKNKTFEENLKDLLAEKGVELASLKESKKSDWVKFDIKAAGTMLISTNYTGGTYALTSWDPEFARVPRRQPFMRQLVNVRPTSGMYIAWAEQTNIDGDAAWTAEGAKKSQIDFDIVERTAKVEKVTDFIKVSREMLSDLAFLNAEIRQELIERLNLKFDAGILSGSGTSPEIKGILNYAIPTFAVPTGVNTLVAPNEYDVIKVAVTQIVVSSNGAFMPNYVILNPVDATNMELVRDTQGRYLLPPFATTNGQQIAGVQVVQNVGVTAGTFLVGDFSRDTLAIREEVNISVGYENDDFTKNLVTVLAELRAVNYIKTNYLTAFVKGSFATAITALTTP
jgi:HK97 family phage major capsid protein